MGWALDNLSSDARERIARSLFKANDMPDTSNGDVWINGLCPLHDDMRQSFGYNVTKDIYHCLALCQPDGDLVDLWCLVNGYSVRSKDGFKAFKRACAGDEQAGKRRQTPAQAKKAATKDEPQKPQATIPEEIYQTFGPIPPKMLADLKMRRGWNREVIDKLGLRLLDHFRKKTTPYKLFPIKERDRVVIPIRDAQGVLYNLRVYYPFGLPDDAPESIPKIMSWAKGHGQARLFPSPQHIEPGPIILCEGEADTLCALSHGLNAITQTSKTAHLPADQLKTLAGRLVYIAYDADKPGVEYADKIAKVLTGAGCKVHIIVWPDWMGRQQDGEWPDDHGQDLTDFFVKHGRDVAAFMALAMDAPQYGVSPPDPSADGQHYEWLKFFRTSASGRLSFGERLLADYLIDNHTLLYHDKSGQLFKWDGTYFEPWSEAQLRCAATKALGEEATASRVNASCSLVMNLTSMPQGRDLNDMQEWVCLKNGMFNLMTLELRPHDPSYMSTIKLNVSWHGDNAPIPRRWLRYLHETIQTLEVIFQAQEYAGYCLTRETRFGKALLLFGPGADGKSQFIRILRMLVGPQNCSAVSMSGLDDQFQRAALFGKVLNIATEITTNAIQSEMFKAVVTGDPIQASFKHKDSFEFVPYCKLVYATNKMPRVFDNSDGYFRRLLPINFKRQFLEGDPDLDPDLEDKLMSELDGIFAWAVMGLHRLIHQKGFTVSDETLDFMMRYRRYNNPVMGFVQDKCGLENTDAAVKLKELYSEYKTYCSEGGFSPLNRENFFEELQTAARKLREDAAIRRHRPRVGKERPDLVLGIYLKTATEGSLY